MVFLLRPAVRLRQSFPLGKDSLLQTRLPLEENPLISRRYLATVCRSSRAEAKPRSLHCEHRQQRLDIRRCSCAQLFDLEVSSSDAVRFVPMDLGFANVSSSKYSNASYRLNLTPS